ncbi:MAG: Biofilm-associated protein [Fibrobacteres bacterium]|nr:Biofilm-associated protein [Fibrobacterota bacterium]
MRTINGTPLRAIIAKSWILLPAFILALIWACTPDATEGDQYLQFHLSESLKDYNIVVITLVDAADSTIPYEEVWNDSIPDPLHFPKHRLTAAKDKDFVIKIRGYDSRHELVYAKDVAVVDGKPKETLILRSDNRLNGVSVAPGALTPDFTPDGYAYTARVGESEGTLTLTASPMDAAGALYINDKASPWNQGMALDLKAGANVFILSVKGKDGRVSQPYEIAVMRGTPVVPVGVALGVHSLVLYTGDSVTTVSAAVDPAGALMSWSTLNGCVARVDGNGKVTPVGEGSTTLTVAAGSFSDNASVEVRKGEPVLTVGANSAEKPNSEVVFPISLTLTHATLVSFKYALEGGETWDASDSTAVPARLTHSYPAAKNYVARFYVADSRGNKKTFTRTINVSSASLQVSILSPGQDTMVNVSPVTVKYTINGTALTRKKDLVEGANSIVIDTVSGADSGSSAPVKVILDTKPPKADITSPAPNATLTSLKATLSGTVSDAGTGIKSVAIAGQTAGPPAAVVTGGTWTSAELTLGQGPNTLVVTATDSAGNSTKANLTVNVNLAAPVVDITYPLENTVTNQDTITVKYTVGNGPEQKKGFNLTKEGSIVLVINVPNGTGTPGTASVTVIRDVTPPNAPTLAAKAISTKGSPEWTWSSNGDNPGGSGIASTLSYQYQLNGTGAYTRTGTAGYTLASAADGAYSLTVQQVDKAGNWSASSNVVTITVDKVAPTVSVTSPASNHVTNAATVPLVCKENGVDRAPVPMALPLEGANVLTCTATDAAGNSSSQNVTVYKRSNVLFVRIGGTGNSVTSKDWVTAHGSIQSAIDAANTATGQKQIWVAGGTYLSAISLKMKSKISIYGGFHPTNFGKDLEDRAFGASDTVKLSKTPLSVDPVMYLTGESGGVLDADTLDGLQILVGTALRGVKLDYTTKVAFNNVQFIATANENSAITAWGSDFKVEGCSFTGFKNYGATILAEPASDKGGIFAMNNSKFSGNSVLSGGDPNWIRATCDNTTVTNSEFADNPPSGGSHIYVSAKLLTVTGCKFKGVQATAILGTWGTGSNISSNTYNVNF